MKELLIFLAGMAVSAAIVYIWAGYVIKRIAAKPKHKNLEY